MTKSDAIEVLDKIGESWEIASGNVEGSEFKKLLKDFVALRAFAQVITGKVELTKGKLVEVMENGVLIVGDTVRIGQHGYYFLVSYITSNESGIKELGIVSSTDHPNTDQSSESK